MVDQSTLLIFSGSPLSEPAFEHVPAGSHMEDHMVKQLQHGGLGAEEGVCGGEGHTISTPHYSILVHTKVNVPSIHVHNYAHTYKLSVTMKEDGEETTNICTRTSVVQSCDCQLTQRCIQSAVSSTSSTQSCTCGGQQNRYKQ